MITLFFQLRMFFNDNCIPTPIFSYVAPIALVNSVQKCLVPLNYFYKNCYHSGLFCTVFCNPLTPNSARQFLVESGLTLSLSCSSQCLYSMSVFCDPLTSNSARQFMVESGLTVLSVLSCSSQCLSVLYVSSYTHLLSLFLHCFS